jgi:hypothetical protein
MSLLKLLMLAAVILPGQDITADEITYNQQTYSLYPTTYPIKPDIPSPLITGDGAEYIIGITLDNECMLMEVTVENGKPLNYADRQWYGKGRQIDVDSADFPTLAEKGLHSDDELNRTKSITGKPVTEITRIGRPEMYSRAGFLSHDEDVISVLKGDNSLVARLDLTHPDMAKPLFHIFNMIITVKKDSQRGNIKGIIYNDRIIYLKFSGAKGWQESIFDDEILGYWQMEIRREPTNEEKEFLEEKYPHLSENEMTALINKLSYIHTGEMVPFYIMRYGFYEGHTSYRADPIAIAFIFGLRSIEAIEAAFPGRLYEVLTCHFTADNK